MGNGMRRCIDGVGGIAPYDVNEEAVGFIRWD